MEDRPIIEKYVAALSASDYKSLASCFSADCRYIDYSPATVSLPNHHVYGRPAVEMFFTNRFTFGLSMVSNPVVFSDSVADYHAIHVGQPVPVQARIDAFDEAGLIRQITILPRT